MFSYLKYLFNEGFEVSSLAGYEKNSGKINAKILYIEYTKSGTRRLKSELFPDISQEEMEKASDYFLKQISIQRDKE